MCRQRMLTVVVVVLIAACASGVPVADDQAALQRERGAVLDVGECRVLYVKRVPLASDRAGILSRVVEEGGAVEAGQIVAVLHDAVPQGNLAVAEARAASDVDVRLAQKEHARAVAEYAAAVEANESTIGNRPAYPVVEILRRQLAAESAELQVEQAERDLEVLRKQRDAAEAELQAYTVRSPITGFVVRTLKEVGEGVQQVEPILEVVSAETMRVEGFVPLDQASRVRLGMPVQVYADVSGPFEPNAIAVPPSRRREAGPYEGKIGFVDLAIQPVARTVRVWANVQNSDGQLRDGMTARMQIQPQPVNQ